MKGIIQDPGPPKFLLFSDAYGAMGTRTLPLVLEEIQGEYRVAYQVPEGLLWTRHSDSGAILIHLVLFLLTDVPTINEGTTEKRSTKGLV